MSYHQAISCIIPCNMTDPLRAARGLTKLLAGVLGERRRVQWQLNEREKALVLRDDIPPDYRKMALEHLATEREYLDAQEVRFEEMLSGIFGVARSEALEQAAAWAVEVQLLLSAPAEKEEEFVSVGNLVKLPSPRHEGRLVVLDLSVGERGDVRQAQRVEVPEQSSQ